MGNNCTIYNQTSDIIGITIVYAGSKKTLVEDNIDSNSSKQFNFPVSFCTSKTFIINVNDNVARAVSIGSSILVSKSTDGLLQIIKARTGYEIETSLNEIIENEERGMNWNLLTDNSIKSEFTKAGNDVINTANEIITYLGYFIGNVKVVPNLNNIILKFMKTSNLVLQKDNTNSSESCKNIKHQLIAISRTLEIDYQYIKNKSDDTDYFFKFLHGQLMKITNTNILPTLEVGESEEDIVLYISAICLALKIFYEMRELDNKKISQLENEYILLFKNNLKTLWENILNMVTKESKIKTTGILFKTSYLKYRNQHIYKMKSICKTRLEHRINDVKNAFIKNRKYQMGFMYMHPDDVINMLENVTVEFEKSKILKN